LVAGQPYRLVSVVINYLFCLGVGGGFLGSLPGNEGVAEVSKPAILGVALGAVIGFVYIALQRLELRRKNATIQPRGIWSLVPGAAARLAFLVVAWWLAFQFTDADKYWLTGALVVSYSLPLVWQLKQMIFPKR
jgi:hypothetical protein